MRDGAETRRAAPIAGTQSVALRIFVFIIISWIIIYFSMNELLPWNIVLRTSAQMSRIYRRRLAIKLVKRHGFRK